MNVQPTLEGELLLLRPLTAADRDALFACGSDPRIWEVHPNPLRWKPEFLNPFVDEAIKAGSLAVTLRGNGAFIGTSRYYELDAVARSVAIGYTFLACAYWGGRHNGELKKLMLEHAFRCVDSVIFHIGEDNKRSRRAVEKIGASFESRTEKLLDGKMVPYVVYRIAKPA